MECSAMRRGYFRGFTASEKTELWDRWQRGESLKAIGRAFGKPSSSIYFQLAPHGGIRPPPRRRARLALTLAEREEISRAIALDQSARSIARLLGRSPSSVSREISRNGGYDRYRAAPADEQAWNRARRPKRCKLATNSRLRRSVAERLRLNWSPEQIAGWLKRTYPEDESCQSIFRKEPTCRCTRKPISTKWPASSMSGHARPWDLKPRQRNLTPVLRRPVELAGQSGQGGRGFPKRASALGGQLRRPRLDHIISPGSSFSAAPWVAKISCMTCSIFSCTA